MRSLLCAALMIPMLAGGCLSSPPDDDTTTSEASQDIIRPPFLPTAYLYAWNGDSSPELSYYDQRDPIWVDKAGGLANAWRFRFNYNVRGTVDDVIYQLTLFPPAADGSDWDSPAGLFDTGSLALQGTSSYVQFNFDFTRFQTVADYNATAAIYKLRHMTPPPPPAKYLPAKDPVDFYLRITPVDITGRPMATSNTLHIFYGYQPHPQLDLSGLAPGLDSATLTPVKPAAEDFQYRYKVTQDVTVAVFGTLFHKGDAFSIQPASTSWYDDICNAVGQIISFIKDAVNWVAKAYDTVKETVVSTVASAIPGCDAPCRSVLESAVDAGLAAAGLPPSLPDFDKLVNDGFNYVVDEVADEGGIDRGIAEQLVGGVRDQLAQAKQNGNGGNAWLAPDPDFLYRSGTLSVLIRNNSSTQPLASGTLSVVDRGTKFYPAHVGYPSILPGATKWVQVPIQPKTPWNDFETQFDTCLKTNTFLAAAQCLTTRHNAYLSYVSQYTSGLEVFDVQAQIDGSNGTGGMTFPLGNVAADLSRNGYVSVGH